MSITGCPVLFTFGLSLAALPSDHGIESLRSMTTSCGRHVWGFASGLTSFNNDIMDPRGVTSHSDDVSDMVRCVRLLRRTSGGDLGGLGRARSDCVNDELDGCLWGTALPTKVDVCVGSVGPTVAGISPYWLESELGSCLAARIRNRFSRLRRFRGDFVISGSFCCVVTSVPLSIVAYVFPAEDGSSLAAASAMF
ncbi:hypothetical protein NP493_230g02053 [Ridgeia piscesae]|uniref:Secreted protein n=1 Tax=Ridgeia piscesae TaxID=27915 RepID=A0AAD9NZY1_RIDPI|nr:hypothetical protein NP493_230g02053 [Ridgeia piscesae]